MDDWNSEWQKNSIDSINIYNDTSGPVIEYRCGVFTKTYFKIMNGMLKVRTRPVPTHMSRSIRCNEINVVQTHIEERKMYQKGSGWVIVPYTCLSAYLRTGLPVVLLKLEGEREDMDRLANEITNLIVKYRLKHPI